jgi:hypothetical protein
MILGGIEVPLTYTESGPGDEVLKQNLTSNVIPLSACRKLTL